MNEQQATAPVGASTGATEAQIEAAIRRLCLDYFDGDEEKTALWMPTGDFHHNVVKVGKAAEYLVPPGYVIVPAASLPSEETRAAVKALMADREMWRVRIAKNLVNDQIDNAEGEV